MSQFNFIYAEEHLSHREKAVYIYLRDRADASGVCWPGIKTNIVQAFTKSIVPFCSC